MIAGEGRIDVVVCNSVAEGRLYSLGLRARLSFNEATGATPGFIWLYTRL